MKKTIFNSDAMIACIKAFLDPNVICHDDEFHTVVGRSRSELNAVLATWPIDGAPTEEQLSLVHFSTGQLLGFPHRQDEYISTTYGISREQIELLKFYWEGWCDGKYPARSREWRNTPRSLHLFGSFSSSGIIPYPRTPLFLWVASDIAEFFKEGTHKESYRRIRDVLRAHVDSQKE